MQSVLFPGTQYPYMIMAICFLATGFYTSLIKGWDKDSASYKIAGIIFLVPSVLSLLFLVEGVLNLLRGLQILDSIIIK